MANRKYIRTQPTKPQHKSLLFWLQFLDVGESHCIETSHQGYGPLMRNLHARKNRMPDNMKGWEFAAELYTCVPAKNPLGIRYMIRITRTR